MKAIEERLKQKEMELKRMDEVKKERDRKAQDERQKESDSKLRQREIEEQAKR